MLSNAFKPYGEMVKSLSAQILVRHDIDYQGCVKNLPYMLDLALDHNITPDVFIRTDQLDYDAQSMKPVVDSYKGSGIQFGLHTSCYINACFEDNLKTEITKYQDCFDSNPKGVTFHGYGNLYREKRRYAGNYIAKNFQQLGFEYADVFGNSSANKCVIEDCHIEPEKGRYFCDDVEQLELIAGYPLNVLILTHPCYWSG